MRPRPNETLCRAGRVRHLTRRVVLGMKRADRPERVNPVINYRKAWVSNFEQFSGAYALKISFLDVHNAPNRLSGPPERSCSLRRR